ncbi:cell division-specific peptidoglycan biosynthesis regulator FtsW [Actinocorallia herbida]|uniref:Probable peptidoglycan glycosyltransferase FtsW n=1 Tax=Actinocorallia herbida TaxID=58109 RepID=A0A3N1CRL0_9ACTN|nr:cell division-specific peptidoglycan biosynthesis regulator FtsW [Actinocorallia herbida]
MTVTAGGEPQSGARRGPRAHLAHVLGLLDRPLTSYYLVIGCTLLLLALGLTMVLSASSVNQLKSTGSAFTLLQKQATWVAIGLPLMAVTAMLPPRFFRVAAYPILLLSVLALALVLVPGLGQNVNGATRWLSFGGGIQLQPSEPAKLGLVLWGADLLARKDKLRMLNDWRQLLIPLLPGSGLLVLLVMLGNDLGTTLIVFTIFLALLWVIGAPARLFVGMTGLVVLLTAILIVVEPYRMNRLTGFLDPTGDPLGAGYQSNQGLYMLGSGGLFGTGLGEGRAKWEYLPHGDTDFIFAVLGEELGLVGTLIVLGLFGLLAYAGLRVARRVRDPFMRLAATGVTAWVVVQAIVNIGAVINVLPITGIPLPLVSYGGSALIPTLIGLGVLLSFAKREPGARQALAARGPGPAARALSWLGLGRSR